MCVQLSTCAEFADDFVSEYTTFKGEKGEAEAYCYFFRYMLVFPDFPFVLRSPKALALVHDQGTS